MAAGWTAAATTALLGVWGEENVQGQLDSVKRNRSIYEKISSKLSEQAKENGSRRDESNSFIPCSGI